jgi:hypothetical protein
VGDTNKKDKYAKNADSGRKTVKRKFFVNASLIRKKSRSTTPPFLLTFDIFNRNVHNCMVDSGSSSNVMPLNVCEKLNAKNGNMIFKSYIWKD